MNVRTLAVSVFIFLAAIPVSADNKKKKPEARAMLNDGRPAAELAKGLGTLWHPPASRM